MGADDARRAVHGVGAGLGATGCEREYGVGKSRVLNLHPAHGFSRLPKGAGLTIAGANFAVWALHLVRFPDPSARQLSSPAIQRSRFSQCTGLGGASAHRNVRALSLAVRPQGPAHELSGEARLTGVALPRLLVLPQAALWARCAQLAFAVVSPAHHFSRCAYGTRVRSPRTDRGEVPRRSISLSSPASDPPTVIERACVKPTCVQGTEAAGRSIGLAKGAVGPPTGNLPPDRQGANVGTTHANRLECPRWDIPHGPIERVIVDE